MRLIDADYLKILVENTFVKSDGFIQLIDETKTAYDIDKVVEELESFAKLAEDRWTNGTSEYAYQEHKCWVKAIETIKHGGVSDDCCEWQPHRNNYVTSCEEDFVPMM